MNYTQRNNPSMDKHFKEVKKHPVLTIEQQDQLAALAQSGDTAARDILINSNLRLAITIAKRYKVSGIEIEDLISAANESIVKALSSYKIGNNFPSWAYSCITRDLIQYISRYRYAVKFTNHMRKMEHQPLNLQSYDAIQPGYDDSFEDFLPGSTEQEQVEDERNYNENLIEVLKNNLVKLKPKQREVIEMLYYKNMSISEIALELGITRQAIENRLSKSLKNLRFFLSKT